MKVKPIDPALLEQGDLFRGKYYKRGKNHVYSKVITLNNGEMLVTSLCDYCFDPNSIHEPLPDNPKNNCILCEKRRKKL